MESQNILVTLDQKVAQVKLNRPEVMNALNQELIDDLFSTLRGLDEDRNIRAVVLSGAGKSFCAGGDVSFLKVISSLDGFGIEKLLEELFYKLTVVVRMEKPVIAALHGFVLGAGFNLSLLCDIRMAARTARFGAEFPMMGIIPELGGTYMLPALVGLGKALELVLTARRFDALEAEKTGLVNRVVPDEQLIPEALSMAHHLAGLPPLAVKWSKKALRQGAAGTLTESLSLEAQINALCYQTGDHKEATSAFLEKRKPVFKGR
jgi:enoyl-CoA hydratase/carnithine racemase